MRRGRKEGKRIGYHEALDYAYARARDDVMRRLDAYLLRNGLATDETLEEVEDELNDIGPEEEQDIRDHDLEQEIDERRRLESSIAPRSDIPLDPSSSRQAMRMPEPEVPEARTPSVSGRPKRSNTFLGRLRWRQRPGEQDRNVEVNRGAPDVASFADNVPNAPLRRQQFSLLLVYLRLAAVRAHRWLCLSRTSIQTLRLLGPISNYNRPRTPSHPRVDIPPDNFIPLQDANGNMEIPPPHEMQRPPPTPGGGNSPIQGASALPSAALTREPMSRDFYYENQQQPAPRYQRSVAGDSVISTATSNLSILTPPGGRHASTSRLSAIHETSPYGERSSLRDGEAGSIRRPLQEGSERVFTRK